MIGKLPTQLRLLLCLTFFLAFFFFFGSDIKEYRMLFIVSQCHFSNTVVMGTTVHIDGRHDNGLPNNLDDFYGIRMTKGSKIMLDYWSFFQMIFGTLL